MSVKRKPSKAVAALEAAIRPEDARPRICSVAAEVYQAVMLMADACEVWSEPAAKGGRAYAMGPLKQAMTAKAGARLYNQGLVGVLMRDGDRTLYKLTDQGRELAAFAHERFPEGIAYPTLKYIRSTKDVREDEEFRRAFGVDQGTTKPKARKAAKVAA